MCVCVCTDTYMSNQQVNMIYQIKLFPNNNNPPHSLPPPPLLFQLSEQTHANHQSVVVLLTGHMHKYSPTHTHTHLFFVQQYWLPDFCSFQPAVITPQWMSIPSDKILLPVLSWQASKSSGYYTVMEEEVEDVASHPSHHIAG